MLPPQPIRKALRTLILGCLLLSPGQLWAQTWGLNGGVNRSGLSGDRPEAIQYSKAVRMQLGGFGEVGFFGDTQLRVELAYAQRGTRIGHVITGQREPDYTGSLQLDYLSVPMLVKIRSASGRLHTTSGLDLSFLLAASLQEDGQPDIDVKDQLLQTDLAIHFGFGGLLRRDPPQVGLEVRYFQSLYNLGKNIETVDALPVRFRCSGLQLLLSIGFTMAGAG